MEAFSIIDFLQIHFHATTLGLGLLPSIFLVTRIAHRQMMRALKQYVSVVSKGMCIISGGVLFSQVSEGSRNRYLNKNWITERLAPIKYRSQRIMCGFVSCR